MKNMKDMKNIVELEIFFNLNPMKKPPTFKDNDK